MRQIITTVFFHVCLYIKTIDRYASYPGGNSPGDGTGGARELDGSGVRSALRESYKATNKSHQIKTNAHSLNSRHVRSVSSSLAIWRFMYIARSRVFSRTLTNWNSPRSFSLISAFVPGASPPSAEGLTVNARKLDPKRGCSNCVEVIDARGTVRDSNVGLGGAMKMS